MASEEAGIKEASWRRKIDKTGNVPHEEKDTVSQMIRIVADKRHTGNRILALMKTIIRALSSRDSAQQSPGYRPSGMETRLAGAESHEKTGR